MTVKELIEHLSTFDSDLPVCYSWSPHDDIPEVSMLQKEQIEVIEAGVPTSYGSIERYGSGAKICWLHLDTSD